MAPGSSPARTAPRVRLFTRPGNDLTYRFTLILESLAQNAFTLLHHRRRGGVLRRRFRPPEGEKVTTFTSTTVVQLRFLSPCWGLGEKNYAKTIANINCQDRTKNGICLEPPVHSR